MFIIVCIFNWFSNYICSSIFMRLFPSMSFLCIFMCKSSEGKCLLIRHCVFVFIVTANKLVLKLGVLFTMFEHVVCDRKFQIVNIVTSLIK